jgi:hypothetical protein
MKVGDYIKTSIYGHAVTVQIVALCGSGTVDVVTKEGQYFRLSGFSLTDDA